MKRVWVTNVGFSSRTSHDTSHLNLCTLYPSLNPENLYLSTLLIYKYTYL